MYHRQYRQFNLGQTGPDWVLTFNSPKGKQHAVLDGTDYKGLIEWTIEMVEEYNSKHAGSPYCWRLDEEYEDAESDVASPTYEYRRDMQCNDRSPSCDDAARAAADAALYATAIHEAEARTAAKRHEAALLALRKDYQDLEVTVRAAAVAFIIGFLLHSAMLVVGYNYLKP